MPCIGMYAPVIRMRQWQSVTKDVPGMTTSDPVYGAIMTGHDSDLGGDYRRACEWPVHLRAVDAVLRKEAASVDLNGTTLTKAEAKCIPEKCAAGKQCDVRLPVVLVASDTPEVVDYISREVRHPPPLGTSLHSTRAFLACTSHVRVERTRVTCAPPFPSSCHFKWRLSKRLRNAVVVGTQQGRLAASSTRWPPSSCWATRSTFWGARGRLSRTPHARSCQCGSHFPGLSKAFPE